MKRAIWRVWSRAGKWKGFKLMRVIYEDFKCKICGSADVVKYGKLRGIQRWWCKDCHHILHNHQITPKRQNPDHWSLQEIYDVAHPRARESTNERLNRWRAILEEVRG